MTVAERTAAVAAHWFTPRQAAFLSTVMLHAGVCVPPPWYWHLQSFKAVDIQAFITEAAVEGFDGRVYPSACPDD